MSTFTGPALRAEDAAAPRVDGHAGAFELHVAVDAGDLRPAVGVVERGVARLERDEELALLRIGEREVGEVARQRHADVASRRPA